MHNSIFLLLFYIIRLIFQNKVEILKVFRKQVKVKMLEVVK